MVEDPPSSKWYLIICTHSTLAWEDHQSKFNQDKYRLKTFSTRRVGPYLLYFPTELAISIYICSINDGNSNKIENIDIYYGELENAEVWRTGLTGGLITGYYLFLSADNMWVNTLRKHQHTAGQAGIFSVVILRINKIRNSHFVISK